MGLVGYGAVANRVTTKLFRDAYLTSATRGMGVPWALGLRVGGTLCYSGAPSPVSRSGLGTPKHHSRPGLRQLCTSMLDRSREGRLHVIRLQSHSAEEFSSRSAGTVAEVSTFSL